MKAISAGSEHRSLSRPCGEGVVKAFVAPAKAGAHNRRPALPCSAVAPASPQQLPVVMGPGSALATLACPGRRNPLSDNYLPLAFRHAAKSVIVCGSVAG